MSSIQIKYKLCAVVCMALLSCGLFGQKNLDIERITTEDGLSQSMVTDIIQDRDGFLWIATKDGLNRYDGKNFKIYTNNPNDPSSIIGNHIHKIFEDSKGRIWALTNNEGVSIYDKYTGRFHHLNHDATDPFSISSNHVANVVEDSSGYFVIQMEGKYLNLFKLEDNFFSDHISPKVLRISNIPDDKKRLEEEDIKSGYAAIRGIVKDHQKRIWVSGNNDIYLLDVQKGELDLALKGYGFDWAHKDENRVLFASLYGLEFRIYEWDGQEVKKYKGSTAFADGARGLAFRDSSQFWFVGISNIVGLDASSFFKSEDHSFNESDIFFDWVSIETNKNMEYPFMTSLMDKSGNLWIGTAGYGLYKINTKKFLFDHRFKGYSVRSILPFSNDKYYVRNYVHKWLDQDSLCVAHAHFIINTAWCYSSEIMNGRDGCIWYGHRTNLVDGRLTEPYFVHTDDYPIVNTFNKFNPKTGEYKTYRISWEHQHGLPNIEARDGSIWLSGNNNILSNLEPSTGKFVSFDIRTGDQLEVDLNRKLDDFQCKATALYEDKEGMIWMGTEKGFSKCIVPEDKNENLRVSYYSNVSGDLSSLSYNHVTSFVKDPTDPDRFIWISTKGGGINRFNKECESFEHITIENGLPDNIVYGLLLDDLGNIWGSTNKGLFCLTLSSATTGEDKLAYSIRTFSKSDGLQDNEFNTGAFARFPDGRLAFGGINGLNIFDPAEVLKVDFSPKTMITNILVNNQSVLPEADDGILRQTIETADQITLTNEHKILTLEFASLDYNAPDAIRYRYQLIGADDTWIEAGNHATATFLNLDPNSYIFRVQGTNSQGIWSDNYAEIRIVVLPPWWKTWWAYTIYALLIFLGAGAYLRFTVNRAKLRQQLQFEKREKDRVKDLDTMKTQLYMNLTHEFRTPLTIILGLAKQMKEDPKAYLDNGLNMIIDNGQNLLGMVNKMLNLSKLESGKMKLDLQQGDIIIVLRLLTESFRSYASKKEIQIHFLPEEELIVMDFDHDKIQQIVSNLLSNAFKFTPAHGHIYFSVRREDHELQIRVKDTGRGISEEDHLRIFDRFYQSDNSTTREYEGTGIGLALCKQLVLLMNGNISVESPPSGSSLGAEFKVALPITNTAERTFLEESDHTFYLRQNGINQISQNDKSKPLHAIEKEAEEVKKDKLILLVEDNEDIVAYVASILKDYNLIVAMNGHEGFELASERIPDLIISDVMMPIMDGFELLQCVKSDEKTNHIPIIMLTARADMDSKLEGLEYGANVYLPKPFEKQELLFHIINLFDLRQKLQHHYLKIAGLTETAHSETKEDKMEGVEDEFVIKVRELVHERLKDFNFTVEDLAKGLHLSQSQLGRKLSALTGLTPNRFIRNARLKKAERLLLESEESITSIAFESGFNDPSYFIRVFKKEKGQTPQEWRMVVSGR